MSADSGVINNAAVQAFSLTQENVMNLRIAAGAIVAVGALGLPAAAVASPLPDPPPRTSQSVDAVQPALDRLVQAYRLGPVQEKHSIHNEIVLLINVGRSDL